MTAADYDFIKLRFYDAWKTDGLSLAAHSSLASSSRRNDGCHHERADCVGEEVV